MMDFYNFFWYLEEVFLLVSAFYTIRQGFRDETFGVPFVGVVLHSTWGFWFAFYVSKIYLIQPIYFLVQCIILGQLSVFGPNEFFAGYRLPFYGMLMTSLLSSLALMKTFIDEEGRKWSHSQLFFAIMFITNVLYVHMLLSRGDSRGQHMMAAVFKCLAMFSAWIYHGSAVGGIFIMGAVVAELVYIGLLYMCLEDPQSFRHCRIFLLSNTRGAGVVDENEGRDNPLLLNKGGDGSVYKPTPTMEHHEISHANTQLEMLTSAAY